VIGGDAAGGDGPAAALDAAVVDAPARDAPAVDAPADAPAPPRPDAAVDANPCPPSLGGPALVFAGSICIDATEVTNANYQAFLAANARVNLPAVCSWKDSFVPDTDGAPWPAIGRETHPVVNMDWCDAVAFCQWAGKRLCRRDEWQRVCSRNGTLAYPYGPAFDRDACNSYGPRTMLASDPVASNPGCVGPYPGLFDLSGNVEEWVDDCDTTPANPELQKCRVIGGSWGADAPEELGCSSSAAGEDRTSTYFRRGFRCCAPLR
jgi:formylglycine-generating enzyme required for sulfatase activity